MHQRKRASLFEEKSESSEPNRLNLSGFTPEKPPEINPKIVESISQDAGFTTTHAPKVPKKRDGRRLKKSGRTVQFNVRLKPETAERFWAGAEKEDVEYADDFLRRLLDVYEKGE